jgi:hypothetical protein
MTVIPVSSDQRDQLKQCWGNKSDIQEEYNSLQACIGRDWIPSSGEKTIARPFHQLRDLRIEADSLAEIFPSQEVYNERMRVPVKRYAGEVEAFARMIILPLRPLVEEARVSKICVELPSHEADNGSDWHDADHPPSWTIARELGAECDRYDLRGFRDCCSGDDVLPRAPKHMAFVDRLQNSHDHQAAFEFVETFCGIFNQYIDWESELALPQSMLWKLESPDANTGTAISLYDFQEQHPPDEDDNDDAPRTCRQAILESFNNVIDSEMENVLFEAATADDGYEYEFQDGEDEQDEDFHPRMRQLCTRLLWRGATVENLFDELRRRIIVDLSGVNEEDMIEAIPENEDNSDDDDDDDDM